jgi:hypothetical protein
MRAVNPLLNRTCRLPELPEQITAAMDRRDRRGAVRRIAELAPQVGNMHVDRAVERTERAAEHGLRDALLADDAARFAKQQREEVEIGRGQRDRLLVHRDAPR